MTKFKQPTPQLENKLTPATGRQPAGTVNGRGPGSCLHPGCCFQAGPSAHPAVTAFGKSPPVKSGLSRREEEEVHSFSGSRAGRQPLWSLRTGHNPSWSLLPSAHSHTARQAVVAPKHQPLQRQAQEQVRQSTAGRVRGPWQRWVLKEGPLVNPLSWEPAVQAAGGHWLHLQRKSPHG